MKKSIILSIAAAAAFATAAFTANTVSAATDTAVVKKTVKQKSPWMPERTMMAPLASN